MDAAGRCDRERAVGSHWKRQLSLWWIGNKLIQIIGVSTIIGDRLQGGHERTIEREKVFVCLRSNEFDNYFWT